MVIEHQREHCFWVAQRFQRAAIQALTLKTNCRSKQIVAWERLTHNCSPAIGEKYFEPFHYAQTIARNASRAGDRGPIRTQLRVQILPDQRGIDEEAQTERKRNDAEGGCHPGVGLDTRDQRESRHIADRSSGQQNAKTPRARSFGQIRLHGNVYSTGQRGEPLIGAQLAHAIERVHGCHGNSKDHNDCCQAYDVIRHGGLLRFCNCVCRRIKLRGDWEGSSDILREKNLRASREDAQRRDYRPDVRITPLAARPFSSPGTWKQSRSEGGCGGPPGVRRAENPGRFRLSSWWCRRQRSSCGTRQDGLRVRPCCGRRARRRRSSPDLADIKSIPLFAISAHTFLEVTAQPFPQLQPSPQQPRLYRRNAEVERISRFLG